MIPYELSRTDYEAGEAVRLAPKQLAAGGLCAFYARLGRGVYGGFEPSSYAFGYYSRVHTIRTMPENITRVIFSVLDEDYLPVGNERSVLLDDGLVHRRLTHLVTGQCTVPGQWREVEMTSGYFGSAYDQWDDDLQRLNAPEPLFA